MTQSDRPAGRGQRLAGIGILAVLASIAAGVFVKQFYYDPAIFSGAVPAAGTPSGRPAGAGFDLAKFAPAELVPAGPAEEFDRQSLSDKIDGKAETYLPVGFVRLDCRRFSRKDQPKDMLEAFVFDMDSPANAYAVFSVQRRIGSQEVPLGDFAYRTANSLYFCHGRHYVELIAAVSDLGEPMLEMGRNFVAAVGAEKQQMEELSLFPPEGLAKDSIIRVSPADFGVGGFENVYRATYVESGKNVTAFLSGQDSAGKAADLAKAYREYFGQFGANETPAGAGIPGGTVLDLDGICKIVFARGRFVAGVDQSQDVPAAQAVAQRLYRRLGEVGK